MGKSTLASVIKNLLKGFAISIAVLFAVGILAIFYRSYKSQRVPIYQTVMTDFEVMSRAGYNDEIRSDMQRELQKIIDRFGIKTLNCFLFLGHTNRPNYSILMVGRIPADADFSGYAPEKHTLKRNIMLFSALKLCGAEPLERDDYLELYGCLCDYRVFIYRSYVILEKDTWNPTALLDDEQKRTFLEQYIRPREP